jgi:hypothetical protein
MRRTVKGKHYGEITAKAFAVLEALLWTFHNAKSGLCYPGMSESRRRPIALARPSTTRSNPLRPPGCSNG